MSKAHYRPLGLRRVGNGESRGDADNGVVLGIDFGSTNMVVAAMQDGDVEVLANDIGARTTPSCVHVQVDDNASPAKGSPSPRKTWEERQTGEAALRLAVTDPDRTIRNVKRVLGRQYETVCVDPGKPLLGPVKLAAGRRGATRIRLGNNTTDQTFLSPEEIVGTLLREAKKTAETHLNRGEIRQAVISVPAFFNVAQRQALIDAASLAGLKVSRLVNETTAAALAYAHDREGVKVVVVVDIGGGGGSVSVARVDNNGVKVVTTSAKRLPGGEDFDKRMVTHLRKVIKEKHSKDIEDHRSLEILRSCWEKAKQKLSRIPHVDITTYLPAIDQELNITMPRSVFEAECKDLFELILEEVRTILSKSLEILEEDSADVFDHVVLVGGSSRIPRLRAEISDLLPGKLLKALNPDEAVARGAALLAAKAVRVEREVLVLTTQITFNQTSFTVKPCFVLDPQRRMVRPLPSRLDSKVMQYFKAEQADPQGTGEMVTIYESEAGPFKLYFNLSGLMVCLDLLGDQMFLTPPYCLDKPRLTQLTQKMERQISGEKVELDRAQAKNSLENFLREELGREVIQDEWQEQDELLRNRCQGILDEISQDANLSQVRANELLSAVTAQRKEIEKPRQIAMMEVRKAELRESLAKLLEGLLQEEAAPDTVGLRAAWTKEDEWLKGPGQEANLADLQTHLAEVERGKEELDAAREARRQEAKQKLVKFVEAFSRSLQDVDAELCSSSGDLEQNVKFFNGKCKEASEWLERHPNSMETDYDSQQKHVAGFRKAWNLVARSHFKIALDTKLKEALNLCPQEEWSTRYLEKFLSMKAWLESESESALLSEFRSKWVTLQQEAALLKKDLNQKTSDLRDKLRKKLDMCLNTKVSKETLCHPQALEFEQYCRELQKRVENNPTVAQQTLSDLYTELNKRSLDLRRSQSLARKMQLRKALSKLVRAIQAKQINQQDIARDLEEGLLNICTKNYLPILVNEKSSIDEIQSCLDEASHKDTEIRNERMSRNVARDLLQSVLTLVVEKHGGSELATPHLQWLQSYPAFPAEEFDKRRHQFLAALADAGQLVDIPQTPPRLEATTGRSSIGTAMEVKSDPDPMDFDETSEESAKVFHTMKATRGSWLHDEAVTALMSAMWGRAVENTAPRGWEAMPATGLPPSVLSHQLEVLQALATALALQTLREVKEAGPMSLLVDTQQNESRGLISLGIRFVDGRGRPVERLLVVREQQVSTDDGAELLQAFLSLCNQADYACWKDNLTGVSAEATGPAGKTFIRHLNEIVHGDSPETQSTVPELVNAGLPLEKRVAAACYDRLRQDETFQVAVEFFSTIDSLRFLFAATSQNFPLLRKACASLQPGEDPWRSYATAIRFVTAERDGVAEALRDLVDARPSLYQMVAALTHALSPSRDDEDSFTVCLAAFRSVFGSADTFFKHVGFPGGFQLERTHLLREHPFASVQDVMKALLTPIRNLLTKREWTLERQKDLESVVLTCVVVTVNEVHRARDQLLFVADALNQPLSEAAPQAAVFGGAEFAAEIEQLNAELRDHEYATLAGALAGSHLTQPELRQHFPRVFDVASRALAAPLLPPDGPRSSDMLQRASLLTAGCPADRVGHYAMLVAYPYPEHKPTLEEAFRILAETESSRLQQDAC